ncbi:hypothetical protein B4U79_17872 [Dinothrombium tinctorium]|uniref:TATA-box-binding protein-like protein n=1 Tax=Dinothrombium tinctorium TaxID=1965070 RepID=A0A443RMB1_9ACAR|nr:hypothetical protein B4U79_17872 [Dinothrombium tinctorium]
MVLHGKLPFQLDPFNVKEMKPDQIQYEPELFPGIKYFVKDTKICVTIISNGKFFISGVTSKNDATEIIYSFYLELSMVDHF